MDVFEEKLDTMYREYKIGAKRQFRLSVPQGMSSASALAKTRKYLKDTYQLSKYKAWTEGDAVRIDV